MSSLFLIRHGQASFGAADYDVLSELGEVQSKRLGAHLASNGFHIDAVYSGPRKRQLDTARHLLEAARNNGTDYPEHTMLPELDEYPAFELVKHWMPILGAEDPAMKELISSPALDTAKRLDAAFGIIISRWASGELDTGTLESFADFGDRVERGLRTIMAAEGRGKHVAVVTSGGPISMTMRLCLGLADDIALRIMWNIANSSISEFRYRDDTLSLAGFNAYPHLDDKRLVTYR